MIVKTSEGVQAGVRICAWSLYSKTVHDLVQLINQLTLFVWLNVPICFSVRFSCIILSEQDMIMEFFMCRTVLHEVFLFFFSPE